MPGRDGRLAKRAGNWYNTGMINLPEGFAEYSLTALVPEERRALLQVLEEGAAWRGMRLRPGVPLRSVSDVLPGAYAPIPWAKDAYYIEPNARPGAHPLHWAGAYYVQEPSAMCAVPLLDVRPGHRVLDLCAAPGGKSTQIAALLAGEGVLAANEPVPARAKVLSQNIERLGVTNALVLNESPERLASALGAWFDRVLVDAPCSGEGMFRREPETRAEWTRQTPAGCAERQLRILESAAALLRPGGHMVYSTCTFNETENEGVVEAFLAAHPAFILEETRRVWPHREKGEGHFAARLRHTGGVERAITRPDLPRHRYFGAEIQGTLRRAGEALWLLPDGMPNLSGLRALRTGLKIAEGTEPLLRPDHALAMAQGIGPFERGMGLDDAAAIRYLAGETLPAEGFSKGWTAMGYRGLRLGWAKCADGVMKNHLPKGLRVR